MYFNLFLAYVRNFFCATYIKSITTNLIYFAISMFGDVKVIKFSVISVLLENCIYAGIIKILCYIPVFDLLPPILV